MNMQSRNNGKRASVSFANLPAENNATTIIKEESIDEVVVKNNNIDIESIDDTDDINDIVTMTNRPMMISRIYTEDSNLITITQKVKRPAVDIEFHDLSYTVNTPTGSKTILKGISGLFEAGRLSTIIGPSGAGKTSLMNVLIGYASVGVSGTILTNNHPRKLDLFHKLSTYIMQEDLLQPNLTVFESVLITAHLKLGNELTNKDKINAVNEVLESMGLSTCKHVRTNDLSGGQKKRTSIALELVNNPPVLFLDEPTSGLDTVTTVQCLQLLKNLAKQGRTIVCTLHQPSATMFYSLDQVYLMAEGLCVYQGSPHQMVPFLNNFGLVCKPTYNPADFALEILNSEVVKQLSKQIENGKLIKQDMETNGKPKSGRRETLAVMPPVYQMVDDNNRIQKESTQFATSSFRQFCVLLKRKMTQIRRDSLGIWIQLGHHIFSALFLGGIYINVGNDASRPFDNFKFCVCVVVFFIYTYTLGPILIFPQEIKLLKREYFNRWYGLKPYYLVTLVSSIPNIVIFGCIFQSIVYILSDQPLEVERFVLFCIIGFFAGSISEGIGILVGSICDRPTGTILAPALLAPMLVIAVYGMGYGEKIEPMMDAFMSLSYIRYLLVSCCITLWGNGRSEMICPDNVNFCPYKDSQLLLRDLGMSTKSNAIQLVVLINFFILFRLLAYLALRYRLNKELSSKVATYMKKLLKLV